MENLFGGQTQMRNNMTAFKYGTKEQADAAAATRIELPLTYGDTPVYMWQENGDSIKLKADLITQYDLAGFSAWRLGFETADIWDILSQY